MALPFFIGQDLTVSPQNNPGLQTANRYELHNCMTATLYMQDIGRVIILFDPEHFNDVYKPIEGVDPPLYKT